MSDDLLAKALAAVVARNREITADLDMLKRINAVLLSQIAQGRADPEAHVFETIERLRSALHSSDDPLRREAWENMERCLDDVGQIAAILAKAQA